MTPEQRIEMLTTERDILRLAWSDASDLANVYVRKHAAERAARKEAQALARLWSPGEDYCELVERIERMLQEPTAPPPPPAPHTAV